MLAFMASFQARGQTQLYGEQTRGEGKNAELTCEPLIVTETVKITNVEGDNSGFWIEDKNSTIQSFFKEEAEFFPEAVGFVLQPGKYWVYPNLKDKQEKATVTITLE